MGWFDTAFHVPLIIRDPRPQFDATRGTTSNAFTEHVDVTPTICDLLDIDVPLQCDGRPLTSFLEGATPDRLAHRGALTSSTSAIPTAASSRTRSVSPSRSARSPCSATTTGSTCSSRATTRSRPIFFDIDNDPEQLTNVAADPAYAPKVLDYAQRMLAWRMSHTERTLTGMKLTQHAGLVEYRPRADPESPNRVRVWRR